MKRLLLGTALTAACLIVLAGVGYADLPIFQNVPENPVVSAGTNDTAVITFTPPMSVTSDEPPTDMTCLANNGSTLSQPTNQLTGGTFTLGLTLVICTGSDSLGDTSTTIFVVTVVDQQLSFANVPFTITEDATSPAGATVAYTAPTAFEGSEVENIPVTCVPASGSVFAINPPRNSTTVTCTATDTDGSSTATFLVHVRGAAEQITNLIAVVDSIPGGKLSFEDQLDNALTDVNAGNISLACGDLSDFINHVRAQSGKQLTVGQANQLISAAAQIRAVLGCG
jgi:hypothetical protein